MALATAIALGGLALSAGSTAMSFAQVGEQKKKQRDAEAAAATAMEEARKKLSINYANELAVRKEPYELQREAMLIQGAQAIQAGQESDRGAAVTAGKVQMAQNEAQAGIRTAMGAEMTDIQKQQIAEQSRLRDLNTQLDLEEVAGQQMIARDAQEAATAAQAQGMQGLTSTVEQGLNQLPLYFGAKNKFDLSTVTTTGKSIPSSQSPIYGQFQSPISDRYSNYEMSTGSIPTNFSGVGF
jgi:hypothetical protein